jgi:alanyl-tRNA synthetase
LLSIAVSDGLIIKQKINASQLIRQLAPMIDGGGGGQPFYATAGGKNVAGLQKAFEKASELF